MKVLVLLITLILGVLAAPVLTPAQTRGKLPVVGVLVPGTSEVLSDPNRGMYTAFLQGLREFGYIEGQTIHLESRFAMYQWDRLPALAAELVRLQPDVIVTDGGGLLAARQATTTIPIVVAIGDDLVELGLVASLARPGGNITGQILRNLELEGKRLELLKDAVPTINHVAVLVNAGSLVAPRYPSIIAAEAQALGVRLHRVDATTETLDVALATITTSGANALLIQDDSRFSAQRQRILEYARTHRLPTVCGGRQYAEAGCLVSYSANHVELFRRAAVFVDKILKGTPPADLPIERPRKLVLFLNAKTAEDLGMTFPPALLLLVDEVIK